MENDSSDSCRSRKRVGRVHQLSRRQRAQQPAERAGELERLRSHRHPLAAHVDEHHLQPSALDQVGDEEVTGVPGARRGPHRGLRFPACGERGDHALPLQPVAQLGQHRLAERHRKPAALPAGLVEDQGDHDHQAENSHRARAHDHPVVAQRHHRGGEDHAGEHHERDEPEQQHAHQQPHEVRLQRHPLVGVPGDREGDHDAAQEDEQDRDLSLLGPRLPTADPVADVRSRARQNPPPRSRHGCRVVEEGARFWLFDGRAQASPVKSSGGSSPSKSLP